MIDAYFEEERAYWKQMKIDSAKLFLHRTDDPTVQTDTTAKSDPTPLLDPDIRVCHFPTTLYIQPKRPSRPYWKKAFYEALSPESINMLLDVPSSISLLYIYDQNGNIKFLKIGGVSAAWKKIPTKELAHLNLAIRKFIHFDDNFKQQVSRPKHYYIEDGIGFYFKELFNDSINFPY